MNIILILFLCLSLNAQPALKIVWAPDYASPSQVSFHIDTWGTWTILDGKQVHIIPQSSASGPAQTKSVQVPADLLEKKGLTYEQGHFYWIDGHEILRRRLGDRIPEPVVSYKDVIHSFVVLPGGEIGVICPRPVLKPREEGGPTPSNGLMVRGEDQLSKWAMTQRPWLLLLAPGKARPVKEIPWPDSLQELAQAGLLLPDTFVVCKIQSHLLLLHPSTGRLFAVNAETFSVKEVEVPWHTLNLDAVRKMWAHAGGVKDAMVSRCTLLTFSHPGMMLRWVPSGPDSLLLFYPYVPISKELALNVKDARTGEKTDIPNVYRPDAEKSLPDIAAIEGVYRADLLIRGDDVRVVPLDRISILNEPSSQNILKDRMVPMEKGGWVGLDRWIDMHKPPAGPPPGR